MLGCLYLKILLANSLALVLWWTFVWIVTLENFVGEFTCPCPLVDLCLDGVLFPGRT